jgi:hypothetical protein
MGTLPAKKRRERREQYQSLDPFVWHEQLEHGLKPILKMAVAVPEKSGLKISRLRR